MLHHAADFVIDLNERNLRERRLNDPYSRFWQTMPACPGTEDRDDSTTTSYAFRKHATDQDWQRLLQNQAAAAQAMDADILAIDGESIEGLRAVAVARRIRKPERRPWFPDGLFDRVKDRPAFFAQNPKLHGIVNFMPLARAHAQSCEWKNWQDFCHSFAGHLEQHNVDMTHGIVGRLLGGGITLGPRPDTTHLIEARPLPVDDIKPASRLNEVYAEATERPKRGDRRVTGGRAKKGPQKPALWKPKV